MLASEELRCEIHGALQVVENWNSGNTVIFYGKDGDLTGSDREHAEVSMLALHLLQSALVHVNTLLLQAVLEDPGFHDSLDEHDRRGLFRELTVKEIAAMFGVPRSTVYGYLDRTAHSTIAPLR